MRTYLVIFCCEFNGSIFNHYATFQAETIPELTELICEYQEDMEDSSELIIISKEIKEVRDLKESVK